MDTFKVRIQGTSALLQHAVPPDFAEESSETIRKASNISSMLPRDHAERAAYRLKDGRLYAPAVWIERAFQEMSGNYKQRGTRKSLKYIAAAAFVVDPEKIPFDGNPKDYEVFSTCAVNQKTKGRIMVHRPRLDEWALTFEVQLDTTLITASDARKILDEAGVKNGIGSWRPQKFGRFGRFAVVVWQPSDFKEGQVRSHVDGAEVSEVAARR